ncbi:ISAs1 family transposase [Dysgonomonas sp. 511]|nr:ISAs1 family transposase [Dysgonomonas sp. 511]
MTLLDCLSQVKDPRRKQGQRFELDKLLLLIIMAMLRGCYHYREIARFCLYHQSDLTRLLKIRSKHMPSHVTIRQLVLSLDFSSLQTCFHKWAKQYVPIEENEWICIDGKAIKSTVSDSHNSYQNFVCLVSLFSQKREQIIYAEKFDSKQTSEITVVEQLIESLDLKDVIFTLDALHCKKNATNNN